MNVCVVGGSNAESSGSVADDRDDRKAGQGRARSGRSVLSPGAFIRGLCEWVV